MAPTTGELPRVTRSARTRISSWIVAGMLLLVAAACHRGVINSNGSAVVLQQSGWRSLNTLDSWRAYKTQNAPRGWSVVDGTITKQRCIGMNAKRHYRNQ